MYTVWLLIHQNCNLSIGYCIGNMLFHFFHDERIADYRYDRDCGSTARPYKELRMAVP